MPNIFVGDAIEYLRYRNTDPLAILVQRPDRLAGLNPERIVWGTSADRLDNIDELRAAVQGPVIQNVTPTVVATSADDLDPDDFTRNQLQQMASDAGLPTSGTKAELQARLAALDDGDPDESDLEERDS